ncbi:MAG: glyoxylate/hydroxypyruvate reductase A [Burkholderiaceae bacterium]
MQILFCAPGANPEPWLEELAAALPRAHIRVWEEGDHDPADYAVVWKPPLEMLQGRSGLKAVFNLGAGVDALLQYGDALPAVPIVRLDDAGMALQMAEYVTYAVLRYFRRFDQFALQEARGEWKFMKPYSKADFTVGILGLGVLGQRIAAALAHFNFPLVGWSRTQKDLPGVTCHVGADGLDAVLRASKALVCVLPLTPETTGILNRDSLGKLAQGSYLINVARGAHVVEGDLLELVQLGHIAGATLDVFAHEPLPPEHPFWTEPNITITPHVSALTLRAASVRQIAKKIAALQQGQPIAGVIDRSKGY